MAGIGQTNYGRLRQRQGTVSSLGTADPVPAYGEFLVTYDGPDPVVKMGDGVRSWNDLPNLFCPTCGEGGGGGGAPLGAVRAQVSGIVSTGISGGDVDFVQPTGFTFSATNGYPAFDCVDDGAAFQPTAEGDYDVVLNVFLTWGATAPSWVRLNMSTYEQAYSATYPVVETSPGTFGLVATLFMGTAHSPAYDSGWGAFFGPQLSWDNAAAAGLPTTSYIYIEITKRA